jgi:gluconolactonase
MRPSAVLTRLALCTTAAALLAGALLPSALAAPGTAEIQRLDPRFDRIVPPDARLEKLADGFAWVEGPVWDRRTGSLLFTDIPNNAVYRWSEGKGIALFLKPSGYSGAAPFAGREPGANGLTFDASGRLVLAEHGDRRIARLEPDGTKATLASSYRGRRLNSPNDLVYRSNGDLYFTDPPFGLPKTFDDPAKELPFQGVYRLTPDGRLDLLTSELRAPNGLAFSPDEKTLYVSDVDPRRSAWLAFDVNPDGTLGRSRVVHDATAISHRGTGAPDGLKVDREGNVYGTGPGGIYVFAPDGTHLGTIVTGVATGNCAWGDDGSVLYVTAGKALYRIRLKARGIPPVSGDAP